MTIPSLEDKYMVTQTVIGTGSYAYVKLGREKSTCEKVAIKIYDKEKLEAHA